MTRQTQFIVQAFVAGKDNALKAERPMHCKTNEYAVRHAKNIAASKLGVVAYCCGTDQSNAGSRVVEITMRLIVLAAAAGLLTTSADSEPMVQCAAAWKMKTPDAVAAKTYKAWSAICLKADYKVPRPPGVTTMCEDGSYSTSKTASDRCSHHSGVAKVL